jgi:hypothetical protein
MAGSFQPSSQSRSTPTSALPTEGAGRWNTGVLGCLSARVLESYSPSVAVSASRSGCIVSTVSSPMFEIRKVLPLIFP